MYSADSSHSSIVADIPRLSSTGLRKRPTYESSGKFCMLRAPICSTSTMSARVPMSAGSSTAQTLEAIRGCAWLEDTTTERVGPRGPDLPAGFQVELLAVNRARPGDDPRAVPADLVCTDPDAGIARAELAVRQFEWLRDGYHLGYARGFDEEFPQGERIRPDYADHGSLVAVAQMSPASMELDLGDDRRHLRRGRVVPHHD